MLSETGVEIHGLGEGHHHGGHYGGHHNHFGDHSYLQGAGAYSGISMLNDKLGSSSAAHEQGVAKAIQSQAGVEAMASVDHGPSGSNDDVFTPPKVDNVDEFISGRTTSGGEEKVGDKTEASSDKKKGKKRATKDKVKSRDTSAKQSTRGGSGEQATGDKSNGATPEVAAKSVVASTASGTTGTTATAQAVATPAAAAVAATGAEGHNDNHHDKHSKHHHKKEPVVVNQEHKHQHQDQHTYQSPKAEHQHAHLHKPSHYEHHEHKHYEQHHHVTLPKENGGQEEIHQVIEVGQPVVLDHGHHHGQQAQLFDEHHHGSANHVGGHSHTEYDMASHLQANNNNDDKSTADIELLHKFKKARSAPQLDQQPIQHFNTHVDMPMNHHHQYIDARSANHLTNHHQHPFGAILPGSPTNLLQHGAIQHGIHAAFPAAYQL